MKSSNQTKHSKKVIMSTTLFQQESDHFELFGRKYIIHLERICDGAARIKLERGHDLMTTQDNTLKSRSPENQNNHSKNLLDEHEAAQYLKVSVYFLRNNRTTGPLKNRTNAPPFIKIGHLVRYDPKDLNQWLQLQKKTSTSLYKNTPVDNRIVNREKD